jgi:hypothetical protein
MTPPQKRCLCRGQSANQWRVAGRSPCTPSEPLCGGPTAPFQHRVRPVPAQIARFGETCKSLKNQERMMRSSHLRAAGPRRRS